MNSKNQKKSSKKSAASHVLRLRIPTGSSAGVKLRLPEQADRQAVERLCDVGPFNGKTFPFATCQEIHESGPIGDDGCSALHAEKESQLANHPPALHGLQANWLAPGSFQLGALSARSKSLKKL